MNTPFPTAGGKREKLFSERVYAVVRRIPQGKTMSYREVARAAGNVKAARAVGMLMKKNYDPAIPCHRVIRTDGALGGYNRGTVLKEKKLRAERIVRALKKILPNAKIALNFKNPWQLLVATILSAQCTDKKVNEVTAHLFKKYRTLEDYVRADPTAFQRDIHATGFFRAKTKSILTSARMVKEKFGGKVPRTMAGLLTLRGVARKSANVVLSNAYGVVVGIAVDTHVRRIAKLLGLTTHTNPVKIERDLMALLPEREWMDFNHRLVEYGRKYCPARSHDHANCPLSKIV